MILFIYGKDIYRSKKRVDFYREGFLKKYGDFNVSIYENDFDFSKIRNDVMSYPFMAEKRLVIIKGVLSAKKENQEKAVELLENIPEETVTLFYEEGEPDKRTALFKKLSKEKLVESYDELEPSDLINWIKKEIKERGGEIDSKSANLLASYVGNDLFLLESEISKLINFDKKITEENITALVKSKTDTNIFDMVDALGKKNLKNALEKTKEVVGNGENEIYVLTMIVRQIRNLLLVKDLLNKGTNQSEITKILKMHPFVIKKAIEQGRNFNMEELKNIYDLLVETDVSIKTGTKEPRLALDLLIGKICK